MDRSSHAPCTCPRCGRALERRRRSLLDRVRTLFTAKARYRCAARCGWEGLLPRIGGHWGGRSRYIIGAAHDAPARLTGPIGRPRVATQR